MCATKWVTRNVPERPANMPIKSQAQYAAMAEAAKGKSTLGIPKKVGKEFIKAGAASKNLPKKVTKRAAGRGR